MLGFRIHTSFFLERNFCQGSKRCYGVRAGKEVTINIKDKRDINAASKQERGGAPDKLSTSLWASTLPWLTRARSCHSNLLSSAASCGSTARPTKVADRISCGLAGHALFHRLTTLSQLYSDCGIEPRGP